MAQFTEDGDYLIRVEKDDSISLVCVHCFDCVIQSKDQEAIKIAQAQHTCPEKRSRQS